MRGVSVVGMPVALLSKPWFAAAGYAPSTEESARPAKRASPVSERVSSQSGSAAMSHWAGPRGVMRLSWQHAQPVAAICDFAHASSPMNAASLRRGSDAEGTFAGSRG